VNTSKGRDKYTWDDCAEDLALCTRLLIGEADTVVHILKKDTYTHPYDALPHLIKLFGEEPLIITKARALRGLMDAETKAIS
jgi:hypothetical protein